jgi:UPF0755 protein
MLRKLLRFALILLALAAVVVIPVGAGWYLLRGQSGSSSSSEVSLSSPGDALTELLSRFQPGDLNERASDDPTEVTFEIRSGETARGISQRLQDAGLIRNADSFRVLLRIQGVDKQLEAGTYRLRRNMTVGEIIAALQHGRPPSITVTIPEGRRVEEIATLLEAEGLVDSREFLRLVQAGEGFDFSLLRDRPDGASLEGYLFPDTYQIPTSWSATQVVELLVGTLDQRFTPEMRQQAAERKLTLHEVITLASIVEREAAVASERPVIASVFLNRLAEGMKLDADPTVQYALGYDDKQRTWWRTLLLDDLQYSSPYNTYANAGLPPGPICNPGLDSIQAVLQPADTQYLYFVANSVAGDGSHVFARTFEEHQRNIARYGQQ